MNQSKSSRAMKQSKSILVTAILGLLVITNVATVKAEDAPPPEVKNVITINPLLAAFGWYTGEYERVLNGQFSFGFSASYLEFDDGDESYSGGDVFLRLFPDEHAPSGIFFNGRVGVRSVKETFTVFVTDFVETEATSSFLLLGLDIGFTHRFGKSKNYIASLGVGVSRLIGDDEDFDDLAVTLPALRLINVGFAF